MAYQAGASLGQFWDAMLKLRAQRLQEQEIEAKLQEAQAARFMQMGSSIGGALGGGISQGLQQRRSDAIANELMEGAYGGAPRATAVNIPWSDKEMAGKAFTGGEEELKMRMAMEKQFQASLAQKALMDQRRIQTAQTAFTMSSKPFQDSFRNLRAYQTSMDAHAEAVQKAIVAGDKQGYDTAVQSANALYGSLMETNPKSNVPPPNIPPFVTPTQMQAITEGQNAIEEQRQALSGMQSELGKPWKPGAIPSFFGIKGLGGPLGEKIQANITRRQEEAIGAKKEEISALEKAMQNLPGAKEYLGATPQARAAAGAGAVTGNRAGQIVNGFPLGQKRVNPQTQEWIIWDGTEWKPLR
jgi:hypothetical protein